MFLLDDGAKDLRILENCAISHVQAFLGLKRVIVIGLLELTEQVLRCEALVRCLLVRELVLLLLVSVSSNRVLRSPV